MASHPFEIPNELRNLAEKSVEEARKAFDGFIGAAHTARTHLEDATSAFRGGAKDAGDKAVSFAEENMRAAFDQAEKVVRAKNPEEVLALQLEFARERANAFQAQIKELGAALQNATKPK